MMVAGVSETYPDPRTITALRLFLSLLSGLMLGCSFPPFSLGVLACFGLIPLLIVLADIESTKSALRYVYLTFLVFHVITLNWTGGYAHMKDQYMMIAGFLEMTLHPLFYFLPMGIYLSVRRRLGILPALIMLPLVWVAYEYSHSLSEFSFPWLTIGNSQSYDLPRIQFISLTGVYGLSLWILVLNVLGFLLYSTVARSKESTFSRRTGLLSGAILLVFFLPYIYGISVIPEDDAEPDPSKQIAVGIIQSNIDPWEKWKISPGEAVQYYLDKTEHLAKEGKIKPQIVLWPETAVTHYFLTEAGTPFREWFHREVTRIGVPVLTGFQHAVFYDDTTMAPPSAKRLKSTGQRYDAFNAAAFVQPSVEEIPWYGKMKMVPIAERVPYADAFYFLDFIQWGVGIGGWQIGPDTVIFREEKTGTRFSGMICYESTYPGFVAEFVRRGAEFISVITIDSWWGKMSGAYQHHQFAIFRAVENRRWVARCAVGGMSSFIDPFGRVFDKTELFSETAIVRTLERRTELTPYTIHGDWLGSACLMLTGFLLAAIAGQWFWQNHRSRTA